MGINTLHSNWTGNRGVAFEAFVICTGIHGEPSPQEDFQSGLPACLIGRVDMTRTDPAIKPLMHRKGIHR